LTISKWTEDNRRLGLVDALRRGHMDFIELFIEYGITLDKLTVNDLDYLYSTASVCLTFIDLIDSIFYFIDR
jgi:hypothetical protein